MLYWTCIRNYVTKEPSIFRKRSPETILVTYYILPYCFVVMKFFWTAGSLLVCLSEKFMHYVAIATL